MRARGIGAVVAAVAACATAQPVATDRAASPTASTAQETPGPRVPLVLAAPSPDFDIVDLLLDRNHVYWAHRGERGIMRVPIAGGEPSTLVPATEHAITSVAADASFLYWTSGRRVGTENSDELLGRPSPRAGHYEGFVARIGKDGKGQTELSAGRFEPSNVAVDGPNVYWVMVRPREGTLVRLPPGTDAPSVVAHGTFAPGSLVVQGGRAYWIDPKAGPAVMMAKLAGEEPKKLAEGEASNPVHPVRLAADDEAVYWTDAGWSEAGGAIVKVPVGEGAASLLAQELRVPRGIATSGGFVYWLEKGTAATNFHDGMLRRIRAHGGAPETLAAGLVAPDRLAVSDSRVSWNEVDGSVKILGK